MPKVFWVRCPTCERDYYVDTKLKGTERPLLCPFCKRSFTESESPQVRV
jgi:hypothetical protein